MTEILVSPDRQATTTRCAEIRMRLAAFAADRLGLIETGEVRGHLLDCDACNARLGDLLLEQVVSGAIPLLTPPSVPTVESFERSLAAANRFGTLWTALRDGLRAVADAPAREWARQRLDEIRVGLTLLAAPPMVPRARGAVRTRGAVRGRSGRSSTAPLHADVLTGAGVASGTTVDFEVLAAPAITRDAHFTAWLRTDATAYDDRLLMCTIALPRTQPVSFSGRVTRSKDDSPRDVRIDEAGVPGPAGEIPLQQVTLTIA